MDKHKIPEATQEELSHLFSSTTEIDILMQGARKHEKENWPKWIEQAKLKKQAEYDKMRNGYELPINLLVPILELRIYKIIEWRSKGGHSESEKMFIEGCMNELGTLLGYLRGSEVFGEIQPDFTLGEWAGLDEITYDDIIDKRDE